jgi:dTDP-4-amino-4,6-dideoxygalactose transaminase
MIPIARPSLGENEAAAAREVILSGWVTQGPQVKTFEQMFAQEVRSRFACAVSSCTTAMHLALLSVGVQPGDVVITVSHSFIATANSVRYCGAEPVFVDVEPETYNMDPDELLRVLREDCTEKNGSLYYKNVERIAAGESPLKNIYRCIDTSSVLGRIAAIMSVHQMGIPCDIARIVEIAKRHRLPVVEDAACAIGSEVSFDWGMTWEKVGKPHGDIACFSFHPRKILTTGDGGMITTNNPELDAKFRLLRHHGMSIPDTVRHESQKVIFENYVTTGFNYRMTDIQAAIGIEQLKRLDAMLSERRELAATYGELLHDTPHLKLLKPGNTVLPNWQSYPVRLLDGISLSQREIIQRLLDKGISCRRGIMNAHQEPPYQAANWFLPKSEYCRDRTILLPLFNGIELKDMEYVASALKEILIQTSDYRP